MKFRKIFFKFIVNSSVAIFDQNIEADEEIFSINNFNYLFIAESEYLHCV